MLDLTTGDVLLLQQAALKRFQRQEQASKAGSKGGRGKGKPKSLQDSLGKFEKMGKVVDE